MCVSGERQFSLNESAELSASSSPLILGIRRQLARMITVECGPADTSKFLVRARLVVVCLYVSLLIFCAVVTYLQWSCPLDGMKVV